MKLGKRTGSFPCRPFPLLSDWGSWCVYAGSYCSASELLKIVASIAIATRAVSLICEGAAWMFVLP